jgi:hypothetical protein
MTEFQTTKIGDRWFLVFNEGIVPVDQIASIAFVTDRVSVKTLDGSYNLWTPVKPSQQIAGTQAEAIIKWAHEHASRIE